jgi:hypothetical protein
MTPETPEEKKAREKQAKSEQAARELEKEANRLIGMIYQAIASNSGGTAPDYPGDKQYSVPGRWRPMVVTKAIELWEASEGVGYHTMTSVKRSGASRMGDTQTNFICKIIGPATKEDHDAMEAEVGKVTAPSLHQAKLAQEDRDYFDGEAAAARSRGDYNYFNKKANLAHKDMNSWHNRAASDRQFKEARMARHNVHVTHDVAKQD